MVKWLWLPFRFVGCIIFAIVIWLMIGFGTMVMIFHELWDEERK